MTVDGSKPTPSSSIVSVVPPPRQSIATETRLAPGMLAGVGERLLDDAQELDLGRGREGAARVALAGEAGRDPGLAAVLAQVLAQRALEAVVLADRLAQARGSPRARRCRPRRRSRPAPTARPRSRGSPRPWPGPRGSAAGGGSRPGPGRGCRGARGRSGRARRGSSTAPRPRGGGRCGRRSPPCPRGRRGGCARRGVNGRPDRTTHSSPRIPSGPRNGRAAQPWPSWRRRRAGNGGSGDGWRPPSRGRRGTRTRRRPSRAARGSSTRAAAVSRGIAQAGDRALGTEEVAGVLGDGVEDVAQVGAPGQLERDRVQGLALALAAVEVGDGDAQLRRARDLARDVRQGRVADVRLDRRVERRGAGGRCDRAADEGQVEDARVDARPAGGVRRRRGLGPAGSPRT